MTANFIETNFYYKQVWHNCASQGKGRECCNKSFAACMYVVYTGMCMVMCSYHLCIFLFLRKWLVKNHLTWLYWPHTCYSRETGMFYVDIYNFFLCFSSVYFTHSLVSLNSLHAQFVVSMATRTGSYPIISTTSVEEWTFNGYCKQPQ